MGLSGPRNRRKLDNDPNNTRWTRDETTFGQKILRAHGWQPGQYLGSQEGEHAQLHSAASLAPIKVNLKDDTLGLGAKILQKASDECTGLDVFKDLLGRLNGKSEDVISKEQKLRAEIKTNLVVERKFGPMRFVSGGFLVGDQMKMEELAETNKASTPIKEESESEDNQVRNTKKEKKEKKSKKRKARETEEADDSDSTQEKTRKKRSRTDNTEDDDDTEVDKSKKKKKGKKEKKSKRSEKDAEPIESEVKRKKSKKSKDASGEDSLPDNSTETSQDVASDEKARKKEKKREKKEKKEKKDKKRADSTDPSVIATTTTITSSTTVVASTPQDSGSSTPMSTSTSTPQPLSARYRSRARHIASKKQAYGDIQAMNQIFMIKPV